MSTLATALLAVENPIDFDDVSPSFSALGDAQGPLLTIGGVLWALCIAGAVLYLAKAFVTYATAKNQGMVEKVGEAAKDIKHGLIALGGLAGLPIIVTGIFAVANS
jgi:hypothetical protein